LQVKCQGKTPQNNEQHGQECKTGHIKGRVTMGGRVGRRGTWLRYFPYMYKYGTLGPVGIISRRGVREEGD
jgi:hypothetical protein